MRSSRSYILALLSIAITGCASEPAGPGKASDGVGRIELSPYEAYLDAVGDSVLLFASYVTGIRCDIDFCYGGHSTEADYQWSVDHPEVVRLDVRGDSFGMRFATAYAVGKGVATVRVLINGTPRSATVEVGTLITVSIEGLVLSAADGSPVPRTIVRLYTRPGELRTSSDSSGFYLINGLSNCGPYCGGRANCSQSWELVAGPAVGYEMLTVQDELQCTEELQVIDLHLQPTG